MYGGDVVLTTCDQKIIGGFLTGVLATLFFGAANAQQKPVAAKVVPAAKPSAPAVRRPPRGPIEKFDCKIGTEDQHARIAVLAQGGEVQSVAYYSKWKPRTCSVHLQRGDAYSQWKDVGDATTVITEFGDFLIQASRSEYQLFFREVDRMHYCGMMGKLNGSMTVTRGPKRQCSVEGIMERNEIEALNEKAAPSVVPSGAADNANLQTGRADVTD
jgi:hypothetical protein